MRAALHSAIEQQPGEQPPFSVLREASADVARTLQGRRKEVARRAQIIASSAALMARDRAKKVAGEAVLAKGLSRRGVPSAQAALLGRIGVACQDEALSRWLGQDPPPRTLALELNATFRQLAALVVEGADNLAPLEAVSTVAGTGVPQGIPVGRLSVAAGARAPAAVRRRQAVSYRDGPAVSFAALWARCAGPRVELLP